MAKLSSIAYYVTDKISSNDISLAEYVTTDCILQNKKGRKVAHGHDLHTVQQGEAMGHVDPAQPVQRAAYRDVLRPGAVQKADPRRTESSLSPFL